jgi:truncated hemoglobin YjbI
MTEIGYEEENGYKVLDRLIEAFWKNVKVDEAIDKNAKIFQFSDILRAALRNIKAGDI